MEKQVKNHLKTFLKSSRIINLICLLCFRLVEKQVAKHQFQRISTLQNNHGTGALKVPIHHHHLACLLCSRLVGEQIIEHPLEASLGPPRTTNLACLLCSRLVEEQVAEHQSRGVSTPQNNHGTGALAAPIHHHHLACLLCSRLVEKQVAEHQSRGVSTPQRNNQDPIWDPRPLALGLPSLMFRLGGPGRPKILITD